MATSQEALTKLERDKRELLLQVDEAAKIAGLQWDEQNHDYTNIRSSLRVRNNSSFREQWLLKWVLKKLTESVERCRKGDGEVDAQRFISHEKTWNLLLYLLTVIRSDVLLELLVERRFTRLLLSLSSVLWSTFDDVSGLRPSEVRSTADDTGKAQPPRKRRRLSPDAEQVVETTALNVRGVFLQVIDSLAKALRQRSGLASPQGSLSVQDQPFAWASSLQEASELVVCVLKVGKYQMQHYSRTDAATATVSPIIIAWLDLWHDFSTIGEADKETVHKQFCRYCLNACLDLLDFVKSTDDSSTDPVTNALERQIALHAVVPLRSEFMDKLTNDWKKESKVITWSHIKPLYERVKAHLSDALTTETIMGVEFTSLQRHFFGSQLISIAARLIPPLDQRRRKWEQPWMEAFTLTLMHLAHPQELPRLVLGADGHLVPDIEDLPRNEQLTWPIILLSTLIDQHTTLSLPASIYLYSSILSGREKDVPVDVLNLLVQLNSDVFLPQRDNIVLQDCLDMLLAGVDERETVSSEEHSTILIQILLPLLRAFARVRDLSSFIELWLPRMQDAFHAQTSGYEDKYLNSALVWADEGLFAEFESLLKSQSTHSLGLKLLSEVSQEISSMPQLVGPTNEIFARLSILTSFLKSRGTDMLATKSSWNIMSELSHNLVVCLSSRTDYQGQRWRLWSLLCALQSLDAELISNGDANQLLQVRAPYLNIEASAQLDENQVSQRRLFLMEFLHAFKFAVYHGASHEEVDPEIFRPAATHVTELLYFHIEVDKVNFRSASWWSSIAWNGRLADMKSSSNLLCGYLGLLASSISIFDMIEAGRFFEGIRRVAYQAAKCDPLDPCSVSSLAQVSQVLFEHLCSLQGRVLFNQYMDVFLDDTECAVPALLQTLPLDEVEKSSINRYLTAIGERLATGAPAAETEGTNYLLSHVALLTRLLGARSSDGPLPWALCSPTVMSDLLKHLQIQQNAHSSNAEINVDLFAAGTSSVIGLCRTLRDRAFGNEASDSSDSIEADFKAWCKKTLSHIKKNKVRSDQIVLLDTILGPRSGGDVEPTTAKWIRKYRQEYLNAFMSLTAHADEETVLSVLRGNKSGYLFQSLADVLENPSVPDSDSLEHLRILCKKAWNANSIKPKTQAAPSLSSSFENLTVGQMRLTVSEACELVESFRLSGDRDLVQFLQDTGSCKASILQLIMQSRIATAFSEDEISYNEASVLSLGRLACLEGASEEKTTVGLLLRLELCIVVLIRQPKVIGQSMIDTVLSMLSTLTSRASEHMVLGKLSSSIKYTSNDSTAIYDHLIAVVETLLSRYRRRLNGRNHMLVLVLRNLMRCLFYTSDRAYIYQNPSTVKQRQEFFSSMPQWLQASRGSSLPPASAEKFSRILSSICNPTAASARSAQRTKRKTDDNSLDLNDETKKARRIAAHYMQYLLMEYSRCSLDGVISPEARSKLMPGTYSIFDACDRDLMRTVNASMDTSSRAIFKSLYDDWNKFGRWDQT